MNETTDLWREDPEGDTAEEKKLARSARLQTLKVARGLHAAMEHVLEGLDGLFPPDETDPMYSAYALTLARLGGLREALETLQQEARRG